MPNINISITKKQKEFMKKEDISPSKFFQRMINKRMEEEDENDKSD